MALSMVFDALFTVMPETFTMASWAALMGISAVVVGGSYTSWARPPSPPRGGYLYGIGGASSGAGEHQLRAADAGDQRRIDAGVAGAVLMASRTSARVLAWVPSG